MTPQAPFLSPSLNQAELQHEIERLFGEIERMLDHTLSTEREFPPSASRWAYPPSEVELEPEVFC